MHILDLGPNPVEVALHKTKHTIHKPVRFGIDKTISFALITTNGDPESYKEAMKSLNHESWIQGLMEEMESLRMNKIWYLVEMFGLLVLSGCS